MITLANRSTANRQSGSKSGIACGWIEIFKNSFALAGMQLQLFKLDSKEWRARSAASTAAFVLGAVLVLAATLVLLASAVVALTLLGLDLVWALLIVGGGGFLLGGLLVFSAITGFKTSLGVFERSQHELTTNLAWLNERLFSHHD